MILGVEHIALSCTNLQHGAAALKEAGYDIKFMANSLPNAPAKQPLLRSYGQAHGIAYAQYRGQTSIELTQHTEKSNSQFSQLNVLLSQMPPAVTAMPSNPTTDLIREVWTSAGLCQKPSIGFWGPFEIPIWAEVPNKPLAHDSISSVKAILLPCADLPASGKFWEHGLGCKLQNRASPMSRIPWAQFRFHSIVPGWCLDVLLMQAINPEDQEQTFLDDKGFPCIALLTNSMEKDIERLRELGAHCITPIFSLAVNQKPLRISIFREPSQQLIELIEIGSREGDT